MEEMTEESNLTMKDKEILSIDDLPLDMKFNEGHVVSIITYSILMFIAIGGNSTILFLICKRKKINRSRINTMVMHLAIADLLVALLTMPLEIGWSVTVTWTASEFMCKLMLFLRVFGIYLSSFIIVCISIDRYYAILKPLKSFDVEKREKVMLIGAWIGSFLFSIPQVVIFHIEYHPKFTWFKQCVSYNSFPSQYQETLFFLLSMIAMYWFPLIVIIYTYSSILMEIYKNYKESISTDKIRRSSNNYLGRAKIRTLKMTIIIVFVFIICWTPYYIMSLWYFVDRESHRKVDPRIQKGFYIFACTNSCMNPIVYGAFNIRQNPKKSSTRPPTLETRITTTTIATTTIK